MTHQDLKRLTQLETRIAEISKEFGCMATEIDFEIVSSQRMLEAMAYRFPVNFSHWSFGRDYEKHRTIYDHTGQGIPYEQVWNFDRPKALLVESNPLPLNVLVIAHVYWHVDYFLRNRYLQRGRSFSNVAEEARAAANRFNEYEARHGIAEVEQTIDAAMSLQWQQDPDPFAEDVDEEIVRAHLLEIERAKLGRHSGIDSEFRQPETQAERERIEKRLREILYRKPVVPVYDHLGYILQNSRSLRPWQKDIVSVIRNQARALLPNMRTKMLDEGWATYWHARVMRRLFEENLLSADEHGVYNVFHSSVTRMNPGQFNWYRIGPAVFEYVKERWDKGRFGKEYEICRDPFLRARWDTGANLGTGKIFEVAEAYSDRMAVEEFFSEEFIRRMQLYIYEEDVTPNGEIITRIAEDDPEIIRSLLRASFTDYGIPRVAVVDSDYRDRQEVLLLHEFFGRELDERYAHGTLQHWWYLWRRKIHLETVSENKSLVYTYDGKEHKKQT